MHQQAKIIFICNHAVVRDAVLAPLQGEFQTHGVDYNGTNPNWVEEQGYYDIWLIDDGVDGVDSIVAHIHDHYGIMGAKIIMMGDAQSSSNDYICLQKPLHMNTLKKTLRDSQNKGEKYKNPIVLYDDLYIHYGQNKICRNNICVDITEKEIALLIYLIQCGDKGAYRDDILWHVWGQKNDLDSHTLETHISALRSKIEKTFHLEGIIVFDNKVYKIQKS